jgi:hypothetical protein
MITTRGVQWFNNGTGQLLAETDMLRQKVDWKLKKKLITRAQELLGTFRYQIFNKQAY